MHPATRQNLIATILVFAGFAAAIYGLVLAQQSLYKRSLLQSGIPVKGEIIALEEVEVRTFSSAGTLHFQVPTVRFQHHSGEWIAFRSTAQFQAERFHHRVGDRVEVRYLPNKSHERLVLAYDVVLAGIYGDYYTSAPIRNNRHWGFFGFAIFSFWLALLQFRPKKVYPYFPRHRIKQAAQ
ncbi:hypothetical protein A3SI_06159 [Nitritalea halalkaliphila LW7]|uniref:DUF3592 domain-containing protein n=1 Tax=Nitritalea halalkaliphila LW7 TaxID=1189621 RepID=I5C7D3_9BACT|nr:DUF3592 domain-containing protein [Nitritalea halalkaliphila]EIM77735.1 hypothetical protein A3SI_06159 [Nitritalea halalkaliphila LW7]